MTDLANAFGEFLLNGRLPPDFVSILERAYRELPELEEFLNVFVEDTIIMLQRQRRPEPETTTQGRKLESIIVSTKSHS